MGILQVFTNRTGRHDERIIKLQQQIATLEFDATNLEQALVNSTEHIKSLKAEKERLELTWKTTYDDLQARHDQFAATIKELEEARTERGILFDETVKFLRRVITRSFIRADKPGGRALIEQAEALLRQYGESSDR